MEEYHLPAFGYGLAGGLYRLSGQRAEHVAAFAGSGKVYEIDFRESDAGIAFGERHKTEFSGKRLMIGLHRRGGAAQKGLGAVHRGEHHGYVASVVARSRVELFVALFMLFVDNHQTEVGKGEEHRRACANDNLRLAV